MAIHAVTPAPEDSLQMLHRGEISLDDYLDERVESALALVKGRVSEERLVLLREVVREHVRTDPTVVEMVRQVTGLVPADPADEVTH